MLIESKEDLATASIEKLWLCFKQITEKTDGEGDKYKETKKFKQMTDKVKNGIKIKVPIWYFTEAWYELYPHTQTANIKGYGKFHINEFMEEKEAREQLMIEAIENELDEDTLTEAREQ